MYIHYNDTTYGLANIDSSPGLSHHLLKNVFNFLLNYKQYVFLMKKLYETEVCAKHAEEDRRMKGYLPGFIDLCCLLWGGTGFHENVQILHVNQNFRGIPRWLIKKKRHADSGQGKTAE